MDYSSIGAALQSFGGFVSDRYAQKEAEKKQKEREEAAKRALEEAEKKRIERRQLYKKNTDVSWNSNLPSYLKNENTVSAVPMWRELGTNSRGEVVQDIPANEAQLYQIQQEEELLRNQAQEQARLRGREEEEFGMKKEKHKSSLERDKASIASSRAYAENLKSDGMSGRPKAQDEAVLWKDINNLMSDPNYRAAVEAGDASVLREFQPEDSVVKGLRSVAGMAGVPVPGNSGPSILEELQAEQDPIVRAQMLAGFKRRLEQAAARGLSAGKGVKPQKQ